MSELKPCPFCGGEARWFWNGTVSVVRCMTCCASIDNNLSPTEDKEIRKAEAIAAWNTRVDYHGYEQAAIEAWESIKAWNSRAERTCECIACAYFENKSTCGAYCNYFDRELGDDYDGGCTWGVLSGCKVVSE